MKKIILFFVAFQLAFGNWQLEMRATPVLFTMQTLTGQTENRLIYIRPDRSPATPLWYGTNLVPMFDFTLQPTNGQAAINLAPWGYTIRVDGWPRSAHIMVPNDTNAWNAVTLIDTNAFSPLVLQMFTDTNAVNALIQTGLVHFSATGSIANALYANSAGSAATAASGWPTQWDQSSITNAPWPTINGVGAQIGQSLNDSNVIVQFQQNAQIGGTFRIQSSGNQLQGSNGQMLIDGVGNANLQLISGNGAGITNLNGGNIVGAVGSALNSSSASFMTPRLGFVAARGRIPGTINTGNKVFMMRQCFYACVPITNIAAIFPNFYFSDAELPGANAQISAAVEYPSNTFNQLFFSGQKYGTISNGCSLMSDLKAQPLIPAGALFFIRTYYTNSAGIIFQDAISAWPLDSAEFGPIGTDKTTNGTVGTGGTRYYYGPYAVIGNTTKPSVLVVGDSRDWGTGDNPAYNPPLIGADRWIAPFYGVANIAIPGAFPTHYTSTNFTCLTNYATHLWTDIGINDITISLIVDVNIFAARFNLPTIYETISPYTTSSDGWMSLTGQTAQGGAQDTNRINFNALARAGGLTNELGCCDVASITESSPNSGLWQVLATTNIIGRTNLTQDGLHGFYAPLVAAGMTDPLQNPRIMLSQSGGLSSAYYQGNWCGTFSGMASNLNVNALTVSSNNTVVAALKTNGAASFVLGNIAIGSAIVAGDNYVGAAGFSIGGSTKLESSSLTLGGTSRTITSPGASLLNYNAPNGHSFNGPILVPFLTATNSLGVNSTATYAGPVVTNGAAQMWSSNGVVYLRYSALGSTIWSEKQLAP